MSRWKKKRKRWIFRNIHKNKKHRKRKHSQNHKIYRLGQYVSSEIFKGRCPVITLDPPKIFSLFNNTESTMEFFADFAREISRNLQRARFFIDSSKVEFASVDALIYLIAILQNDTLNNRLKYSFAGNYPNSENAKKVYNESGFNNYVKVKSAVSRAPSVNNKKRIICGVHNDTSASKDLCDFVMTTLGKSRCDILPIQKVLIELMSNVFHHAYEKNTFMAKKWYMYAEHVDDSVKCVFVDTGLGIAKTARKNMGEIIKSKLHLKIDDSKIIQSIFNGEFRTATNEKYRGNGLSSVRENVKSEIFESFEVISGKGRCTITKKDKQSIISQNYNRKLYGTLFQFVIR